MSDIESFIGRTTTATAYLDPAQANRMAVTLDRPPGFRRGDPLPQSWHWLYFHDLARASDLGPEGHPKLGMFLPMVPLPRRMWAGGSFAFHSPLLLGSMVDRTSVVRSITPKEGRSGPLCFVTVEHTLKTLGALNLVEEQTIVYREAHGESGRGHSLTAPTGAEFSREVRLDSIALFRYSALTFNGHRIHYDVDYCRAVEGYPNLLIHGPLVATLLLELSVLQGAPLKVFRYRATSPLFLPDAFTVAGKRNGATTQLWAMSHLGELSMEAEAFPA